MFLLLPYIMTYIFMSDLLLPCTLPTPHRLNCQWADTHILAMQCRPSHCTDVHEAGRLGACRRGKGNPPHRVAHRFPRFPRVPEPLPEPAVARVLGLLSSAAGFASEGACFLGLNI